MSVSDKKTMKKIASLCEQIEKLSLTLSNEALINIFTAEKGITKFSLPIKMGAYKSILELLIEQALTTSTATE